MVAGGACDSGQQCVFAAPEVDDAHGRVGVLSYVGDGTGQGVEYAAVAFRLMAEADIPGLYP